ncbi:unnamed protein product [Bemisia tabaci]|uniref:General transcription factor IIF subunit 2 n=1 Tax=Bemisia tabaci TaxID=7038 RepID=A0A9P0F2M9_BEMTA|nr:PREDICTED: general transcription factor IIF subunit 2 [Bemisia tabaci]CAH0386332.1 unnamed protein product [Bemisia tabaci]
MSNQPSTEKELDVSHADKTVWLVKVPKYIANRWEKAPGNIEVGKLKIAKTSVPGGKTQVTLNLSESVMLLAEPGEKPIPRQHRLDVSQVTRQTLGVFSHYTPKPDSDAIVPETEKLVLEGRISQKLECRPYADTTYMKLKVESIRKAMEPTRKVMRLDRVVQNYKPVSNHKNNIEYMEKKKAEGKKARDDKESVMEMLFAAFEKHQFYNLKDLVQITKQPPNYLKEILNDIGNYSIKAPHRCMWELKPEYRHYKADAADPPGTSSDKK